MKTKLTIIALAALALAGCGNHGVSVSSSNRTDETAKTEATTGHETRVGTTTSSKATVSVPAVALAVDAIRGLDLAKLDAQHKAAAQAVIAAAHPTYGWPHGCFSCAANKDFASEHAVEVVYADEVLDRVVLGIRHGVHLEDPSAAQAAIQRVFLGLSSKDLSSDLAQARAEAKGGPELNTVGGGQPVQFQIGASSFEAGGNGWAWSKNDLPWFGAGKVNGQDVTVALDHANDTGTTQTVGGSTAVGTSTTQGAGGEAGAK